MANEDVVDDAVLAVNVPQHFFVGFRHWGGAKLQAEIDLWLQVPAPEEWRNMGSFKFQNATVHDENAQVVLLPGTYQCVIQCTGTVGINGTWRIQAYVNGVVVLDESGDVAATPPQYPPTYKQVTINVA